MRVLAVSASLLALTLGTPACASENSPWTPGPGFGGVSLEFLRQSGDRFTIGTVLTDLPVDLEQTTYFLNISYGLTEKLAIDGKIGYSETTFEADKLSPGESLDGLADIRIGFRYLLLDETLGAPFTLTARATGIIRGIYEEGDLDSIGDGASGGEVTALVGRILPGGFALTGQVGFRGRVDGVPEEIFAAGGISWQATDRFGFYASGSYTNAFGGVDIGEPGFTPAQLPQTNEDLPTWSVGTSIKLFGPASLNGEFGQRLAGRNTTVGNFFRISLAYSF